MTGQATWPDATTSLEQSSTQGHLCATIASGLYI